MDQDTRFALAQAVRLVAAGRTAQARRQLADRLTREPAISDRWLRDLQLALRR